MTDDQRELWLERAAIYEFEAGLSREEAERYCRSIAARLKRVRELKRQQETKG